MLATASTLAARFIVAWVRTASRAAGAVMGGTLAVTALLIYYTAGNLTVNTDTGAMLSADLPFRQVFADYKRAFPQFTDNLLVVVDADLPEVAEITATRLAEAMAADKRRYRYVFAPVAEPFFQRNGLMFLDVDDLGALIDRLAGVEPLLARLARDPSLRGLFDVLGAAIDSAIDGTDSGAGMADVLDRIAAVIQARQSGAEEFLSWQQLLADGDDDSGKSRFFIVVQPALDFSSLQPARAALANIRALAAAIEASSLGRARVRLTGQSALNTEELASVSRGAALAGVISLILVGIVLVVGLGSARLVAASLVTLLVGLVGTAGFATLAIGYLNMISVAFAVLFIGLGVDFAIHFCLRYREEVDRGVENSEALARAAEGVGVALALCAPTTALAFYAFIPTAYSGLGQLGLISGTGMFIALIVSLSVPPAMLTLLPVKPAPRTRSVTGPGRLGPWLNARPRLITSISLILGLAALGVAGAAKFDFDPMKLRDPSTESVQTAMELFDDPDGAPYRVQVLAGDRRAATELADRLKALPEVARAVTLSGLVPADQDAKLEMIDDAATFMTPVFDVAEPPAPPDGAARRAAVAAFREKLTALADADLGPDPALRAAGGKLLGALKDFDAVHAGEDRAYLDLEQALVHFLPHQIARLGRLLEAEEISPDSLPPKLRVRYLAASGQTRIELFPAEDLSDQDALRRFVRAVQTIAPGATGPIVQTVEGGDAVVRAMGEAISWAGLLITLLLFVVLRRLSDVLLVLLPLALAAVFTVAATVVLNLPFNFANVIVLPLLIGLGVDGGIHLVMRSREARARARAGAGAGAGAGPDMLDSSTPRAVLLSALTTIGSFGSLALSSHRGTASMGELLVIAIAITLVCMLIVLPAMMGWRARREG